VDDARSPSRFAGGNFAQEKKSSKNQKVQATNTIKGNDSELLPDSFSKKSSGSMISEKTNSTGLKNRNQ